VNGAERCLCALLDELEKRSFDTARVERACNGLAAELAALTPETPRAELERVAALHAALRALVKRRRDETARELDAVRLVRASLARLTRPHLARRFIDVDA
jgi:hypothetical protein